MHQVLVQIVSVLDFLIMCFLRLPEEHLLVRRYVANQVNSCNKL